MTLATENTDNVLVVKEPPMPDGTDELFVKQFLLQSPSNHVNEKECAPLQCMFHTLLTDLYDEDYENYAYNDLIEDAKQLFYLLALGITNEQAIAVENRTPH